MSADAIAKEHVLYLKGLAVFSYLLKIVTLSLDEDRTVLVCLASFIEISDPWTISQIQEEARSVADENIDSTLLPEILHTLLQDEIKPRFAKSRHPAITQQGRKAIDPLTALSTAHGELDAESKPWKYRDVYIVAVLQWVLLHLDVCTKGLIFIRSKINNSAQQNSIELNWPLIIPPLLTLIDDSSVKYKAKGCEFLTIFLENCPPPLLERTGLGEVFENAVMPCLMVLPSLTEEWESLQILKAAYPALIALASSCFPDQKQQPSRLKALDRILRYGVLKGYAHAGEHVKIAEVLVHQITNLVGQMGVTSIKYLKVKA